MLAIAAACHSGELHADVALVLSNRKEAAGLAAAKALGIPTAVVEHGAFASRDAFEAAMTQHIESVNPDWILLAGFMRILGTPFVKSLARQNSQHPSLAAALVPGIEYACQSHRGGRQRSGSQRASGHTGTGRGPCH